MQLLKKAKRAFTNTNLKDDKKLDRYLKNLAAADRKKFLKEYLASLKKELGISKRKILKYSKKLYELRT